MYFSDLIEFHQIEILMTKMIESWLILGLRNGIGSVTGKNICIVRLERFKVNK